MQDPNDKVTPDIIPRRPGRPAKHGVAMSPAQRQKAYRNRVREGAYEAINDPRLASRPEIMKELVLNLSRLEADFDNGPHRHSAEKMIRELVTRYDLKL